MKGIIDSLGARETTIEIFQQRTVDEDLTIPANISLLFLRGGSITVANGKTLTINGLVVASAHQIFEGAGTVTLNTYPQQAIWFGDPQEFDFGAVNVLADNIPVLPDTIANVLSNHNVAVHNALGITELGIGAEAKDHGAPATDMLTNICYGDGAPPGAGTTTEGTLWVKYV